MRNTEESIRKANLIARFITDPASLSGEERATVNRWLDESPANRKLYDGIVSGKALEHFGDVCALTDEPARYRALEKVLSDPRRRRNRIAGWLAGTAAAAAVAAAALFTFSGVEQPIHVLPEGSVQAYIVSEAGRRTGLGNADTVINAGGYRAVAGTSAVKFEQTAGADNPTGGETVTVVVPAGGVYSVTLGDGTRVHLNSGSELRFAESFGAGSREVELIGEAFFEVEHDALRPFSVTAGPMTTRVLGTSFNITAYDDRIYSTLVTGSVEISAGDITQTLEPGYRAVLDAETGILSVGKVDTSEVTAWRNGELIFGGMELEDILKTLARWYDVEYTYTDREATGRHTFAGKADRSEDLASILRRLNSLGGPRLEVDGRVITVNP